LLGLFGCLDYNSLGTKKGQFRTQKERNREGGTHILETRGRDKPGHGKKVTKGYTLSGDCRENDKSEQGEKVLKQWSKHSLPEDHRERTAEGGTKSECGKKATK